MDNILLSFIANFQNNLSWDSTEYLSWSKQCCSQAAIIIIIIIIIKNKLKAFDLKLIYCKFHLSIFTIISVSFFPFLSPFLSHSLFIYIYIYIYIYSRVDLLFMRSTFPKYTGNLWLHYSSSSRSIVVLAVVYFSHELMQVAFHLGLRDRKSPQITRTLLSILADLNQAVVWIVSILLRFSILLVPFQSLWDSSKCANSNWYHRHPHDQQFVFFFFCSLSRFKIH